MIILQPCGGNYARSDVTRSKNGTQGTFGRNNRYRGMSRRVNNCSETDDVSYDNNSRVEGDYYYYDDIYYDDIRDQTQPLVNWDGWTRTKIPISQI